jgi:hypothetical protein
MIEEHNIDKRKVYHNKIFGPCVTSLQLCGREPKRLPRQHRNDVGKKGTSFTI